MKTEEILKEFDDLVNKLKLRIIFYQTENFELKKRIAELKRYVKEG